MSVITIIRLVHIRRRFELLVSITYDRTGWEWWSKPFICKLLRHIVWITAAVYADQHKNLLLRARLPDREGRKASGGRSRNFGRVPGDTCSALAGAAIPGVAGAPRSFVSRTPDIRFSYACVKRQEHTTASPEKSIVVPEMSRLLEDADAVAEDVLGEAGSGRLVQIRYRKQMRLHL